MSIITNPIHDGNISGLPDLAAIEKLANELFSAMPNEMPKANFSPNLADHPRMEKALNLVHDRLPSLFGQKEGFNMNNPQTSLTDPHFFSNGTPVSLSGFGVSSAGLDKINGLNLNEINLVSPDRIQNTGSKSGLDHQPSSVAGSGISPSAINQGNAVNLSDPQTSFPDPNAGVRSSGLGNVPQSVGGSGISPSVVQNGPGYAATFPYAPDSAF